MLASHPYQQSFYVLFVTFTLFFYFSKLQHSTKTSFTSYYISDRNSTVNFTYFNETNDDVFVISKDIFSTPTFLNISFLDKSINENENGSSDSRTPIYILGLFEHLTIPFSNNQSDGSVLAAQLAVKHVNALNILPGYKIKLLINDTKCDSGVAIDRLFYAIYSNQTIIMLLGAGCSNVTETLAHIVPYWNILQISYGSKSPTLSDSRKFPLFFRLIPPNSSYNVAKIHFIKYYKWQVIATFSQSENAYLLPVNHLIKSLEKENINCTGTITFSNDNYKDQLKMLKALNIRVIIGSFSNQMALKIFCTIFDLKMYGKEYVWILEKQNISWWKRMISDCTVKQLSTVLDGIIFIGDQDDQLVNKPKIDNNVILNKQLKYIYDAVWAIALTLRKSGIKNLNKFNYKQTKLAYKFVELMRNLKFIGLSGPIRFNGADRIGDFIISQIQGNKLIYIAIYDSLNDKLNFKCESCQPIYWQNGQIPIAQRILKKTLVTIPNPVFYIIIGISLLGVAASITFLYFNMKFRQMKNVKLSSPNLNNLAVIGCILVYISVILFGFNNVNLFTSLRKFNGICSLKIYFLSIGFSLTFGSIFAKSYRVYKLFTTPISCLIIDKRLKDQQLIGMILILLFIDTIIMAFWYAVDPLERRLHDMIMEVSVDDPKVAYQPQIELCQCQNTIEWHVALFGYKGIILIMGVYMAWKTRNIKVAALNESQYIGICVYSCVFSTIIVIIFSFLIDYFVLSYLAKCLSILTSTTIILILMFFPKFKLLFIKNDTELGIMETMGLKIQYNTRRLIGDDPKEMLCRLEIQNRVYRCQLDALDKEISYLEELLRKENDGKTNVNVKDNMTHADMHFLEVPRASWPIWQNQTIKTFSSENDVEKCSLFGKLRKLFNSFSSLQCDNDENDYTNGKNDGAGEEEEEEEEEEEKEGASISNVSINFENNRKFSRNSQ